MEEDNSFESLLEGVSQIIKTLESSQADNNVKEVYTEVLLPNPETLLVQFTGRTVYSSSDACDERLTSRYWLATPTDDSENDIESVRIYIIENVLLFSNYHCR